MTNLEKIALVIGGIEAIGIVAIGWGICRLVDYTVMKEEGCGFREYVKKLKTAK